MLNKLVKISSLVDIQNAKHRHNGLWAIGAIFKASKEIMSLFKTNFMLANNPTKFKFYTELEYLVELNDKFLSLDISDITPANALELYDYADNLRAEMIKFIAASDVSGNFASSKNTTIELLPAIETLTNAYRELVDQSRHNLLASISINPTAYHSEQFPFDQLRKLCSKLQCMQDHEIQAGLTNNTFEFLRLVKQIDPTIKSSLAFQNQGL